MPSMATFISPKKAMHWDRQFLAGRSLSPQRDCPGRTILAAGAAVAGLPAVVALLVALVLAAVAAVAAA